MAVQERQEEHEQDATSDGMGYRLTRGWYILGVHSAGAWSVYTFVMDTTEQSHQKTGPEMSISTSGNSRANYLVLSMLQKIIEKRPKTRDIVRSQRERYPATNYL